MELQQAWRDVIRPTMRREPKTPGNRGVEVVMVDLDGDGVPDPPAPEREDITVTHATKWSDHNSYYKGQTVYCNVAAFSGGSDETQYRWRLQQRDNADSSWVNSSWTSYSDHALEISVVCPEGQIRIHCQARDDSVDPVDQVNSFSALQTVKIPSMGQPRPYIDSEIYDPNAQQPHGVREEQAIELNIELPNNDGGQPAWNWAVRQGSARLSPNGPYCVAFNETAMGSPLAVQVDMIDNNCSDSPHSIRYTMFVTTASREALEVGDPTLSGEPLVGETLTCSQPEITGGSGDLTINYYWQDINSKSVLYMGATQVVAELDVGRTECCQVYVRDNVTGENFTVVSNSVGPITKPT